MKKKVFDIHFVYGSLAVKKFILPISNQSKNNTKIFFQPINDKDIFDSPNVVRLPKWFNVKILLNKRLLLLLPSFIYLFVLLFRYKEDRIITHMTTYSFLPLLVAYILRMNNRIYFNHGFANIGSKGVVKYILFWLEVVNSFLATKVITVSPSHLKEVENTLISKFTPILSTLPGSCCGILKSKIITEENLEKKIILLNNPDQKFIITYIGRPLKRKGYPYILELFKELTKNLPEINFSLQIIGINSEIVNYSISKFKCKNSIKIINYTDDVYKYLYKSYIVVLPSMREGFGYALLEGAACGNALVCFDIIGPDSLVKENYNGITAPIGTSAKYFARKITNLIKDKNELIRLIRNSRNSSLNFQRENVLDSISTIL